MTYLRNLENRKNEVYASIEEQGKMTDEIAAALAAAQTLVEVEDIYRPFKPKRKTRASVAKEKGLEPLSEILYNQAIIDGIVKSAAIGKEVEIEIPEI